MLYLWGASSLGALFLYQSFVIHMFSHILSPLTLLLLVLCTVKKRPKLKSRYKQRIEETIEYARTIDDFDYLVDLQTLALHCLAPEPSAYFMRTIEIEEKKSKCLLPWSRPFFLSLFFFLTSGFLS